MSDKVPYGDYPHMLTSPSMPPSARLAELEWIVTTVDHPRDEEWVQAEHAYIRAQMAEQGLSRCISRLGGVGCDDPACAGHPPGGKRALGVPVRESQGRHAKEAR